MSADAAAALRQLAHDYWEGTLARNPTLATFIGDDRYNDRLPDLGPAGRAREQADLEQIAARLAELAPAALDTEDRITRDMLRISVEAGLEALRLRLDQLAVDQMDGPQVWLPELLNWHPTDTREHVEQLLARYAAFPTLMDQYLANLAEGTRAGRTAPAIVVERVLGQLRALLDTPPAASPLAAPAASQPSDLAAALQRAVADQLYPAFQRMLEFLEAYVPRPEPGIWSVTDGPAIYAYLARLHTTTKLSPDELHAIGRADLATIHAEMRAIIANQGAADASIRAFTEALTRDPANLPSSAQDILQAAEQLLDEAAARLPRAFGVLPRTACQVKPIEPYRERDAPAAYYFPPSADGARPGIFYVNTFEPGARPKHTLPALVFHESAPGHHLQIALAQETTDLPAFRRLGAGWLATAFVEGWGLYAERLADELGLYPDERARFGMLGYQAWRACRLIVDTGLHHLRWSRQQALDFFYDNVGLTARETENEVDRYIAWPGQALAYKIGQREIEQQRQQQAAALGPRFSLPAFHDALLAHAAVPLSTLPLLFQS